MRLIRTLAYSLSIAALAGSALCLTPHEASAQNFFEQLFGIKPSKPPAPPQNVPSAPPSGEAPLPGDPAADGPKAPVVPRQPVVLKAPADDNVNGQELKLNGLNGSLKLDRASAGGGMTAIVTLPGTKISQPAESCSVKLNNGAAVALTSAGKPEGVARFEAASAECPLRFEVLDGSVLATPTGGPKVCTFQAADCAATPGGLWGPPAAGLIPQSNDFDTARGNSDRAVRDNYKIMSQRVGRDGIRPVVQEQAAFSSDREELCRTYAREGSHGFCHLRFTEARALSLAARLGANPSTATASAAPKPRKRSVQPVDGMNPDAGPPAGGGASAFADQ